MFLSRIELRLVTDVEELHLLNTCFPNSTETLTKSLDLLTTGYS